MQSSATVLVAIRSIEPARSVRLQMRCAEPTKLNGDEITIDADDLLTDMAPRSRNDLT